MTGHIEVRLKSCEAITSSGIRIQFDATETGSELVKNYSVESDTRKNITQWDIILSVDPFHPGRLRVTPIRRKFHPAIRTPCPPIGCL
ncbi:hypothetical protein NXV95_13925 [Bacteroides fragilis]|nr:hypothetical protein [Bacteroides fragilis]